MTLKEVRVALRCWGRFWAEKEMGIGFASRSITATMMEIGALGISARSDKHLYSHGSAGVFVPEHVRRIDFALDVYFRADERRLIRAIYVQNRKPTEKGRLALLKCEISIARLI